MSELMKQIMESNRNLDEILIGEYDAEILIACKKAFELQMRALTLYPRGQKILRQLKKDSKRSPLFESLFGPLAKKEELEALREIKKQMKEKIAQLKEKIEKRG